MATLAVTNDFSAGTTIVAADMNENFSDVETFINSTPGVVQKDVVDAVGDLIIGTAADATGRLAVGTNDYVLTADSSVSGVGLAWKAPTTGDITGLTAGTNIDISSATGPVPTIDLAVDAALVTGVDGTGVDVTFHSNTAGDNMLWDASEEKLVITGTNGQNALEVADGDVSITDKLTVTGQIVTHLLVSTESGTTHAPALGDEHAYILTPHGTGITVTLPQNSAQAFAIGTTIYYERNGAGTLTFAAGTGATITSKDSTLTCGDRYTAVCALKIGTNAWSLIGNIG